MSFRDALAHILRWEGGYSEHPADPGGDNMRLDNSEELSTQYSQSLMHKSANSGTQRPCVPSS